MSRWLGLVPVVFALVYAVRPDARAARYAVVALGVFGVAMAMELGVRSFQNTADRATFLAATISESLNSAAFFVVVMGVWSVPMFVGRRRRLAR